MLPSWGHDLQQLLLRRSMPATKHRTLSLPLGRPSDYASPLRAALAPRRPPCRMNYAALHAPPVSWRRLFACRVSLFPLPLIPPPPLAAPRRVPQDLPWIPTCTFRYPLYYMSSPSSSLSGTLLATSYACGHLHGCTTPPVSPVTGPRPQIGFQLISTIIIN